MASRERQDTIRLTHLEPRAHVKNVRVWNMLNAHGAVFCSHHPSLARESLLPVSETP